MSGSIPMLAIVHCWLCRAVHKRVVRSSVFMSKESVPNGQSSLVMVIKFRPGREKIR